MKIQTMSIVVGTRACNAKCPFCVSKQTGFDELPNTLDINSRNFTKALQLAKMSGVTTVLLTGKGEPTLYPEQIGEYLQALASTSSFPFVELQTNGIELARLMEKSKDSTHMDMPNPKKVTRGKLRSWYEAGLTTIALSTVGTNYGVNRRIYSPDGDYYDLGDLVEFLHGFGFSVRLCVMMMKGGVATPGTLEECVYFAKHHRIDQLTFRPIRVADASRDSDPADFVEERGLTMGESLDLLRYVRSRGTLLLSLMHGAEVFDFDGQNVCMSDCLTRSPDVNEMRQIIFYADGRLTYDWQYRGAVLLGGKK